MDQIMGEHWRRVQIEALGLVALGWDIQLCSSQEFFDGLELQVMPVHCHEHRLEFLSGGKTRWASTRPFSEET